MPPTTRKGSKAKPGRPAAPRIVAPEPGAFILPEQHALDPVGLPVPSVVTNNLRAYGADHPLWADAHFAHASLPWLAPPTQIPTQLQYLAPLFSRLAPHFLPSASAPPHNARGDGQQPAAGVAAMNVPHTELLNTSGAQTLALARLLHAQLAGRGQPLGGMGPAVAPARHTPQKEAASAKAWTKPEDQLIVDMMRAKFEKRTPEHTYSSIGRITGRSANAVKCRWQNKLKYEVDFKMSAKNVEWMPPKYQQQQQQPPPSGGGGPPNGVSLGNPFGGAPTGR